MFVCSFLSKATKKSLSFRSKLEKAVERMSSTLDVIFGKNALIGILEIFIDFSTL